jgi:thioredoxin-related protein
MLLPVCLSCRILLAVLFLPVLCLSQDEIPYLPDTNARAAYTSALKTAQSENKHLLIQIGEPGCPACKRLYLFMAAHPAISDSLEKNFITLHIAISRENIPLFRAWDSPQLKHGVPVILILDAQGKILATTPSSAFTASIGEFSEPKILGFLRLWSPKKPDSPSQIRP